MLKHIITISVCLLLALISSCQEGSGKRADRLPRKGSVQLPAADSKVIFVFPAGAGAVRVILGIAEHLEQDLQLDRLGSIMAMAAGVSSGSFVAAGLTNERAAISAASLKPKLSELVKEVFPHTNALVDKLISTYKFSLDELEAIFIALQSNPPDLSTIDKSKQSLARVFTAAALVKPSIVLKIDLVNAFSTDPELMDLVDKLTNFSEGRALVLEGILKDIVGETTLADAGDNNFVAIASSNKLPVFFAKEGMKGLLGPAAVKTTNVYKALIASAAVPGFIAAPKDIEFFAQDGSGPQVKTDLVDGYFAQGVGADPSAIFYDIFSKQFADDNLVIVYVGNGAAIDSGFRQRVGFNSIRGVAQTTRPNGKQISYVALDAKIVDENKNDLFNLSGFYASDKLAQYMDKAAQKATETSSYRWLLKALAAVKK